jgi:hypothetical protein
MPSITRPITHPAASLAFVAALSLSAAIASPAAATVHAGPPASPAAPSAAVSLPPIPSAWPSTNLEVGLADSPNGAAALHASGQYKFRYQYLCGGVNTGTGWATWNSGAKFADYYVDESVAVGITPVFIYYQMLQSKPGIDDLTAGRLSEKDADKENMRSTSTMRSYWADVRLMFQHLGAYSKTIVVDVEPDLWGYMQFDSTNDSAGSVPVAVASSGDSDVAGFANNAAGFAQAFIKLRNKYAPNVLLSYELSMWGTQNDPIAQNIPLDQIDGYAARSVKFQQSLGAAFDLVSTDPSDRDADFYKVIYGSTSAWWDATDYQRFNRYVGDFVSGVGLRMMLWQIPLGNTKMRAMNDTWGHYQDNHVETWLGDGAGANLAAAVDSGVIALLFGGGADGTTSASDAQHDGVTNPAPINGNNTSSYSADDDGGYFRHQVNAYYSSGLMPLPSTGAEPATPATYHPMTPVRLLDTRYGNGLSGKFSPNAPRSFQVTGRAGIPAGAVAVTGNLTVADPSGPWAVNVGPASNAYPTTSTINFVAHQTISNGVTAPLSADGKLWATLMGSGGTRTDLVFDVTGYYTPDSSGDTYHAVTPARIVDSRLGQGVSTRLTANAPVSFAVRGHGGIPTDAVAVTGNVTVANTSNGWAVYLGPVSDSKPTTSTVNFVGGEVASNNVTVQLSSTGALWATFMSTAGNTTDLVFDVTGYYTADATGAKYCAVTPIRLLDTRASNGISGKLAANSPASFQVSGRGPIPATIAGVTGNVTVTNQTFSWAISVGPASVKSPTTSTLNFVKGDVKANGVAVAVSSNGRLYVTYMSTAGNTTDLVFDATGYFVK